MNTHIQNRQTKYIFPVVLLLFFSFLSCEDFVEVDTPNHLLSGENLFNDPKTVEAAMVGIYVQLRNSFLLTGTSQGLSNLMGLYTDEMDYYGNSTIREASFYRNNLLASDETVAELWNASYNQIYASNAIIEGVANSSYFTPEETAQFTGEAKFIRALIHFHLVNLFGEVPYIKTTNYLENQVASRQPLEEVYASIVTDLEGAINQLPEEDVSGEHVRPDKRSAKALLARVYLYMENWEMAAMLSEEVINNTAWEADPQNVFLKESSGTIWQFMPEFDESNTLEAQTFIFQTVPPPVRALSSNFINAFEDGDLRKVFWTGMVSDGVETYYYSAKYKLLPGESGNAEYSKVLRMAEQYLIRAEARAKMGDIAGARADINRIRNRAGLANTTATSENELLTAILQERRVELFTEHGHRFFDLKRSNKLDVVLDPIKEGWDTTDQLLPLPEKELLVNPNLLPQNPGY
ncbi:RagB/SusD family nutrient uptake outer membrane protein [Galbibacter sp.]|uniref:RagB/SusD family nutrient uptake outer membrane protein n=1 Tax=Galbibacter sp. TaxID=2918471 RepID=UPI003A8D14BE